MYYTEIENLLRTAPPVIAYNHDNINQPNRPHLNNRSPHMFQLPPRCDISLNQKLISCESKFEDEVFHSGNGEEQDERHCEKFNNELNHPLMSLASRKITEIRSLSPTDSGISSQSSTPGHYQKYNQPCRISYRGSSSNHCDMETRGTKRHHQNNHTSHSPSPLLGLARSCLKMVTNETVTSRPKRRFQEDIAHGLPPIVASACLININFRSYRPDHLLNGGEWDKLSHAIWCKYTTHEQTQDTLRRKLRLRETVHHFIKSYLHQCGLYIVGSSVSGFGGESSDMDLCLVISSYEIDQRFHALEYLYRVQKALSQYRSLTKLDVIRAKVPILRFFDSVTNLEVDLNCNNLVGIRNTHLLKTYAQLDWRVRPLVVVVKLWAREHEINDAKSMTISSYSLTLMVIHYLQSGVHPPVLTCLQRVRSDRFWPEGDIRRIVPFNEEELKPLRSNNNLTLGQLFAGFLDYFANQFSYATKAISIRTGGTLPSELCRQYVSAKNDPHHWKYLCIEEPFDRTNTARSVYDPIAFNKIVDVFRQSSAKLSLKKELSSAMAT